jgi:hypothetical protein
MQMDQIFPRAEAAQNGDKQMLAWFKQYLG